MTSRTISGLREFSNAVCMDCNLSNSDLSHAKFDDADLYRSNFSGAILHAATLSGTNLIRADLEGGFPYGWLPDGSTNIRYAGPTPFAVERRRRTGYVVADQSPDVLDITFGDSLDSAAGLCLQDCQVGVHRYTLTNGNSGIRAEVVTRLLWHLSSDVLRRMELMVDARGVRACRMRSARGSRDSRFPRPVSMCRQP